MSYVVERTDTGKSNDFEDYEKAKEIHDLLLKEEVPCRFNEVSD